MATALMPTPTEIPWLDRLRAEGAARQAAVAELHELLLKAARFEISRRAADLPHLRGGDLEDLAQQAADDALMAVLRKLDDFRGESRFTTWAYKFALLEAAVKVRRRAWQGREIPLEEEAWSALADAGALPAAGPRTRSCSSPCARRSSAASATDSARSSSRSPSTGFRSTSSPSASARPAALSTRTCTTPAASCAERSPSATSASERPGRRSK